MPGNADPTTDERAQLLGFLAQQRDLFRNAAYGLTDEQARTTPSASALSIGGLVKHASTTEAGWVDTMLQRPPRDTAAGIIAYQEQFTMRADETLAALFERWDAIASETEEAAGSVGLLDPVPVPRDQPWFPVDIEAWNVRWVLLHLLEELSRHAGHADIVRESIDGATGYELMAGREGWPKTDWLTPWQPPGSEPAT